MPRAFITGITGQDGQHLAEFLHGKGYEVFGMVKGQNNPRMVQMRDEFSYVEPVPGDLADLPSLVKALEFSQPDEVYNLGAISFVALSFNQAELTANITGLGVLRMLEAIRMVGGAQNNPIRFYQASSSEMFGKVRETPQTEKTPFHPRSPYGCAKVFGHDIVVNYRESYDMFACSGILFNHEGPRRGLEFVTRKVTNSVARIHLGLQQEIVLGNLDSKRDWGFAGDYVKAMWKMLQQDAPDDYVVATGKAYSIEDLVRLAFAEIGIEDWKSYVRQDPKFFRPAEVDLLIGDPSKAREKLGWEPEVQFPELVKMMVANDLAVEGAKLRLGPSGVERASALERNVDDGFHHRLGGGYRTDAQLVTQRKGERNERRYRGCHQAVLDATEQDVTAEPRDGDEGCHAQAPTNAHEGVPVEGDDRLCQR